MFGNFNCKKEINLLGLNVWIENRSLQDQISLQIKGSYFVCSLLFFSSSWIQYNCQLLTPKLFAPFKHLTWTRPHWEAKPAHATSQIIFSSVTKPLQSWPLWPSWQLWAQICRSSWRLRIGNNVCKRCSLGFDIILFFSLQLYNTSILSWEVQFSEKSQHCSNSEHQYFTRSSSS